MERSCDPARHEPHADGCWHVPDEAFDRLTSGTLLVIDANLLVVAAAGPGHPPLGVDSEAVPTRSLHEVLGSRAMTSTAPHLQAVLAGQDRMLLLCDGDGNLLRRVSLMARRDHRGRVIGALLFAWSMDGDAPTREIDRRYRLLAESATDVVSLRDRNGVFRYISPSVFALCGYRPDELIGHPVIEFIHPDDRPLVEATNALLRAGEDVVEFEYRIVCRDRSIVWVHTTGRALRDPASGELTEVRTTTHDVTERRAREAELRATTAELKLRLRQTAAIAELGEHALEEPDLDRFLADATTKVAEILRVPSCAVLVAEPDRDELCFRAGAGWRAGTIGSVIFSRSGLESWVRRRPAGPAAFTELPPDLSWRRLLHEHEALSHMWAPVSDRKRPIALLAVHDTAPRAFSRDDRMFLVAVANVLRDAIARHHAEKRARHEALHDALTGLPNRRLLTDRLDHALARGARNGARHAVLFLDVDQFKLVNDSLGHDAGDRLLCSLGPRLRAAVRPGDTVARFGGDEFVVLCEDIHDVEDAARLARRLTDAVSRPFDLDGREHVASVSIGVTVTNGSERRPEDVLRDADIAMYRAKEAGRSRFELFDAHMRQHALARLELEDDLRRAIASDELIVHYQPIFAIDSDFPLMIEALVRWQHPERGLLSPATFIPIAEESNLIVALGEHVLRQACADAAGWRDSLPAAAELALTVNASARQISRPTFAAEVSRILDETGFAPHALCLEITEGVLLQQSPATTRTIAKLRDLGVRIVLDDFGTGYSSIGYLRRFSLDVLKIDRSFVAELHERIEDRVIVEAIVTMAHAFGLDITAEGVETVEQLEALRELGCASVQGYLLARPMPASELEAMMRAHSSSRED